MGQELCLAVFHKMVWGQPNRKLSSSWPPLEYKEIQHCEISQMRLIVYKHNFWLKHFQDQGWQQLREQGIHAKAQTEDPHKFRISELQDVLCIWRWLSLQESSHPLPPALLPHLNFRVHLWKNWSQQGKLQHSCWSWTRGNSTVLMTSFAQQSEPEWVALTCLDAAEEELGVSPSLQAG